MKILLTTWALAAAMDLSANPIRRVVNMLQAMQKKVEEEGDKEKELYEKFQCYCKTNTGELTASIAEAQTKISQLETQVTEDTAAKSQLDEELKNHKQDREDARTALSGATKLREKDAETYAKNSGDLGTNVSALGKAVDALEKGLSGGAFLQTYTAEADLLKKLAMNLNLNQVDRDSLSAFLSNSATAPGSSEIVGILKEMKDEMSRDYKDLVATEETAIRQFEELKAAKLREIAAATRAIEKKTQRSGELAVKIVEGKNDLEDTQEALSEDEQFQVNLRRDCAHKEKEQNERVKTRAEELQAIAETIKILNDDDALDLFNKTLPKPRAAAFIQQETTTKSVQERARAILKSATSTFKSTGLDLISLALHGKKVDFSKVLKMIDDMVDVLGAEQVDDDEHRDYCTKEFDTSDDKKKALLRRSEDLTHDKEEAMSASANLAKEIKALQNGIAELDKSVAEATAQRKSEHAEYVESTANNQAALDLIAFAKNRLNKFYNPKLYKPPPPRELTEEERVFSNFGGDVPTVAPTGIAGTGIGQATFLQIRKGAPPPPPETFGAYAKKGSESGGVIAMIDMLSNDLTKDMTQAEVEEKEAQADYEELMADSQKKRAADSKSITTKEQAKAEADGNAETAGENLDSTTEELVATKQYISNLHKSCDFLMENYDFRKSARATEVDALKKAKAVLKGADYSFLQLEKCDCKGQADCECAKIGGPCGCRGQANCDCDKPIAIPALVLKTPCGCRGQANCDCAKTEGPCGCRGQANCSCAKDSFVQVKSKVKDTPCITLCKEMNQYPNCSCPNFTYDATPNHMTWDELFAKFDSLVESGRNMLKDARKNK